MQGPTPQPDGGRGKERIVHRVITLLLLMFVGSRRGMFPTERAAQGVDSDAGSGLHFRHRT